MKVVYLFGQCGQGERREEHQTQPAHLLGLVAALEQRQLHEFLGAWIDRWRDGRPRTTDAGICVSWPLF